MDVPPNVHNDLVLMRGRSYPSTMGGTRDFANEYVKLAADRMAALANAFHGAEVGRRTKPKVRTAGPTGSIRQRREKVRAKA